MNNNDVLCFGRLIKSHLRFLRAKENCQWQTIWSHSTFHHNGNRSIILFECIRKKKNSKPVLVHTTRSNPDIKNEHNVFKTSKTAFFYNVSRSDLVSEKKKKNDLIDINGGGGGRVRGRRIKDFGTREFGKQRVSPSKVISRFYHNM